MMTCIVVQMGAPMALGFVEGSMSASGWLGL